MRLWPLLLLVVLVTAVVIGPLVTMLSVVRYFSARVQQLLIMVGARTQWSLTVTALPLTYLCGWLSWRYVEAPTLALRRYLPRREPRPSGVQPVPIGPHVAAERDAAVPAASA